MRLIGFCTSCRKIKYVRVPAHALALGVARGGVMEGVCSDCESKTERRGPEAA